MCFLGSVHLLSPKIQSEMVANLATISQTVDKALLLQGFAIVGTAFLI